MVDLKISFAYISIILFIFVALIFSFNVNAENDIDINLDYETAISELSLDDSDFNILRDPFRDFRPEDDEETISDEEDELEEPEPPVFLVQGIVSRDNGKVVLVLNDLGEIYLLKPGEEYGDYLFKDYVEGEAVFISTIDDREYHLKPGGQIND